MATELARIIDPDNGDGTHFLSMDLWEDAFGDVPASGDCVGEDLQPTADCRCTGGTADTTAVDVTGWASVDATHYIKAWTDPSLTYRHAGTLPTSGNKYRIEGNGAPLVYLRHAYTQFIGIPVKFNCVADYQQAIRTDPGTNILIAQNIVAAVNPGSFTSNLGFSIGSTGVVVFVINNIVYGFTAPYGTGINVGGLGSTNYVYNNTLVGNLRGVRLSAGPGTTRLKNNLAFDNTTDYVEPVAAHDDSTNNGYTDGQSGPSTDEAAVNLGSSGAAVFLGYGSSDYHLCTGSPAYVAGADLSEDAGYAVTDDIDGDVRAVSPCIGADENFEIEQALTDLHPESREFLQLGLCRWSLRGPLEQHALPRHARGLWLPPHLRGERRP